MRWHRNPRFKPNEFRSENWNQLSDEKRLSQLQALENKMAKSQGRMPREVISDPELSNGGQYTSDRNGNGTIHVSTNDLHNNSFECMDTIFHEGRHAYQDDVINNRIPNTETEATKEAWIQDDSQGCYISSGEGPYSDYYFQPQESDAYSFAKSKMDGFSNEFSKDPKYREYVELRDYTEKMAKAEGMRNHGVDSVQGIKNAVQSRVEERYQAQQEQPKQDQLNPFEIDGLSENHEQSKGEEPSKIDEPSEIDELSKRDELSEDNEQSEDEERSKIDEPSEIDELSKRDELSEDNEQSEDEELSKIDEPSEIDELSKRDELSEDNEQSEDEERSKSDEPSEIDEFSESDELSENNEQSEDEEPSKIDEPSENDELSKNDDMSEGGNIENDGEGLSDDIANTVNDNAPEEDGGVEKDEINQNEAPSDDIANTVNDNAPEEDGGVEKDEINQNEAPSDDIANTVNGNTPEEDGGVEKDGAGQSEMPSSNGGPSNNDGNSLSSVENYGPSQ